MRGNTKPLISKCTLLKTTRTKGTYLHQQSVHALVPVSSLNLCPSYPCSLKALMMSGEVKVLQDCSEIVRLGMEVTLLTCQLTWASSISISRVLENGDI